MKFGIHAILYHMERVQSKWETAQTNLESVYLIYL